MSISPQKGIYKCFSCGAGGDVFKFWSEYHQKDFRETLKDLAQKYGVELKHDEASQQKREHSNLLIKLHELAAEYYHSKLEGSNEAAFCRYP